MSSNSKPSFFHQPCRLSRIFRKHIRVVGLLGTYNILDKPADDMWMAIDFTAWRKVQDAPDNRSRWFCGIPSYSLHLLGDPACDRMVFNPPSFEITRERLPNDLAMAFLLAVRAASSKLSAGETLVIVLAGHGHDDNHSFIVGDADRYAELTKMQLEMAVENTKGDIWLISTCYSVNWMSSSWKLLAAAGPDEQAPSIAVSGSGECRGGFFTPIATEFTDEFNIQPPYPGNSGHRGQQRDHDFGENKAINPSPRRPKRSMQVVLDWIRFRDDIGRTYTSANVTFHPCPRGPHHPLLSASAPFHQLKCVPPSPANDHASVQFACVPTVLPPQTPRALTAQEDAELHDLAAELLRFMPPSIASENPTILQCWSLIYGVARGREPLDNTARSKLYRDLVNRAYQRARALAIARHLGWDKAVQELGGPDGEQMQMSSVATLRRQAEAHGCLVSILVLPVTPYTKWSGAAGWLARVWEASRSPTVSPASWTMAVMHADNESSKWKLHLQSLTPEVPHTKSTWRPCP